MCASNCNCQDCAPDIKPGERGPQGEPGPAPVLSASLTILPPDAAPTVNITGVPPVQNLAFGLPVPAPIPGPAGANGQDATELYTTLLSSFVQPGLDTSVNGVVVGDASFISPGMWIWIRGGGFYRVANVNTVTNTLQLANPGPNFLGSGVGWAGGIPGNTPVGNTVTPDASPFAPTQVIIGAIPGLPGATGPAGPTTTPPDFFIVTTTTIPTTAPAPGGELRLYYDDLVTPTVTRLYAWNGTTWNASPNIIGAQGTIWQTTGGDPNSTLPSGPIGTFVLRTDVLSIYQRTSVSVWTLIGSLTPTFDQVWTASSGLTTRPVYMTPDLETHVAAGVFTIDLTRVLTVVDVQDDIELDYSTLSNYSEWWVELENTTGGSVALTYAAGKWEKNTGVTEPSSIGAGDRLILHIIASKGSLLITEFITPASI